MALVFRAVFLSTDNRSYLFGVTASMQPSEGTIEPVLLETEGTGFFLCNEQNKENEP